MTKDDEDDEFTRIEMEQHMRQEWKPSDMAYRPNGLTQPAQGIRPIESDYISHVAYTRALEVYCDNLEKPAQEPHPAVKSDMLVNGGALKLALNSLRRGTQSQQEIADELEKTAQPDHIVDANNMAQPAQEPVEINSLTKAETDASMSVRGLSKPAQEPVATVSRNQDDSLAFKQLCDFYVANGMSLYTTPQQRPWVGLTDDEFDAINPKLPLFQFHKAIEAKLKSKNA